MCQASTCGRVWARARVQVQKNFKKISKKFKIISKKFQKSSKNSKNYQKNFKKVQKNFKKSSEKFQKSSNKNFKNVQKIFKKVKELSDDPNYTNELPKDLEFLKNIKYLTCYYSDKESTIFLYAKFNHGTELIQIHEQYAHNVYRMYKKIANK